MSLQPVTPGVDDARADVKAVGKSGIAQLADLPLPLAGDVHRRVGPEMTLNITVLTRERIYQSGDFMISDLNTGAPIRSNSMKIVTIQNKNFTGLLTYTGIGSWPLDRDTSEIVVGWLTEIGDRPRAEVVEMLGTRASEWIRSIWRATGSLRKHTFVLATFESGDAVVDVISNFEDAERGMIAGQLYPSLSPR